MLTTLALLLVLARTAASKSLYLIAEITSYDQPTPIHAYDIDPNGMLTFQAEYGVRPQGAGTVGLALDSNSEYLFITFEDVSLIQVLDATTLGNNRLATAPNAENLAGVVYDHGRELLYCVDRGTQSLYAYRWNAVNSTLRHVQGSPFQLENAAAYGIALDEINDLLYVANLPGEITVYNTWDWRLTRAIPVKHIAISVAVDPIRGYLYYGGGYAYDFYLTQYDLDAGVEKEVEIAPDAGVIGLGVDPATGFIYVTTGQNNRPGGDDLLVFNTSLEVIQTVEDIGNPTGLVIPIGYTSYNPLRLRKTVKTSLGGEPNAYELPQIPIGGQFTYSISFDANGYDLQEVSVIDRLPADVTFVDATGNGTFGHYDARTHRYIWRNPPVSTTSRTNLELVGQLQPHVAPGRIIVNLVTLDTDKTPPTTTGTEAVATPVTYKPLTVNKVVVADGTGAGAGTETGFVTPGERITYRICIDNRDNEHAVGTIVVKDSLPAQVDFVDASGNGVFGRYDSPTHTYVWSYPLLAPGESACLDLVAQLRRDATAGAVVTNKVTVESAQTPRVTDTADVTVGYTPIELRKTITAGATSEPDDRGRPGVNPGGDITYTLCFRNPSDDKTVTQISIVDMLPPEVRFVKAEGDGDFGFYDLNTHTYTWFYNPLGPREEACLELVVRVDELTEPNTVISNWVTASSRQTSTSKARVDAVVVRGRAVQAEMYIKPTRIIRSSPADPRSLMAVLHLPEGQGIDLLSDATMMLAPGNIRATSQRNFGTNSQGKVMCFFETDAILTALEGQGDFDLTVTGMLRDGRSFWGKCPLTIIDFTAR